MHWEKLKTVSYYWPSEVARYSESSSSVSGGRTAILHPTTKRHRISTANSARPCAFIRAFRGACVGGEDVHACLYFIFYNHYYTHLIFSRIVNTLNSPDEYPAIIDNYTGKGLETGSRERIATVHVKWACHPCYASKRNGGSGSTTLIRCL